MKKKRFSTFLLAALAGVLTVTGSSCSPKKPSGPIAPTEQTGDQTTSEPTPEPTPAPNEADKTYREYEDLVLSDTAKQKTDVAIKLAYDFELPENDKELLTGAAEVHVFDREWPICLSLVNKTDAAVEFTVEDYFGKVIYQGSVPAGSETNTFRKGILRHPTGYFTVRAGKDKLSYVVTPPYSERTLEDTPFAMDYASSYLVSGLKEVYRIGAAAKISGVTWVRDRCNWSGYEASKGKYNYSSTDKVYQQIKKTGLKNLAMFCAAPAWAMDGKSISDMRGGFRNTHMNIYNLAKDMVKHYEGLVDGWELWNESDLGFAAEPAELYAGWFKSGALGVHDAGVPVTVSFGGYCQWGQSDYVALSFRNGIMDFSDIYNFHAHTRYSDDYVDFSKIVAVDYQLDKNNTYNTDNKPVWVTEAGMSIPVGSASGVPTELQLKNQAHYIVQSTVLSLSKGVDKHFWFVLSPYIENNGDFGTFSIDP